MDNTFWDNLAIKNRTTGYRDLYIASFDQLMRLKCTNKILNEYTDAKRIRKGILLDFGCGKGDFSEFFCDKFEKVYAFDKSQEILKIAQTSNAKGNIQYINSFDTIKDKVDFVFSITVLQHILDDVELLLTLKQIHEKTNPGSLFIALESIEENIFRLNQPAHVKARTFENWINFFKKAGFKLIESKSFYNPFIIKTDSFKTYEARTLLLFKFRNILLKFHINSAVFNYFFRKNAVAILGQDRNVDGIISCHSFSKFFILESISVVSG